MVHQMARWMVGQSVDPLVGLWAVQLVDQKVDQMAHLLVDLMVGQMALQ